VGISVGELERFAEDYLLTLARAWPGQAVAAAQSPLASMFIAWLSELIEDACGTAILGGAHILANRLGIEHTITTLGQQHKTEHLLTIA